VDDEPQDQLPNPNTLENTETDKAGRIPKGLLIFTGHPLGHEWFYTYHHHLEHAPTYHNNKSRIDIQAFVEVIEDVKRQAGNGGLPSEQTLEAILKRLRDILHAPLPQDWQKLRKTLVQARIDYELPENAPIKTSMSMMNCPKETSIGGQKTSASGIAKSFGLEAACQGISLFSFYILFSR
jgi:hypothetical protein